MSEHTLERALTDYLAVRRSLGFKLTRDGLLLSQFVAFCQQTGADRITSEVALAWVTTPAKASPSWLNMRLSMVRGFARWLQASDPSTAVPSRGWLPPVRRTNPYLYSEADVGALMAAAQRARWPLSAATYETLIGLLAVTGLRIGEAIRLDRCVAGRWPAHHSRLEVRQVPTGPDPSEHCREVALVSAPPLGAVTYPRRRTRALRPPGRQPDQL
jgi:integrase